MPNFRLHTAAGDHYVVRGSAGATETVVDAPQNDGGGTAPPESAFLNPATANLDMASNDITGAAVVQGPPAAAISLDAVAGQSASVSVAGTPKLTATGAQLSATVPLTMGANPVTGTYTPTTVNDLVTKGYADGLFSGSVWKTACRAATTGNVLLAAAGLLPQDGVTPIAGDRVLVRAQTAPAENGVYVAGAVAWTRATDFDGTPANEVQGGTSVLVQEGTLYAGTQWAVSNAAGNVNVGVDPMTFVQISSSGVHTHDASAITTGTLDRARLPVGTTASDVAAGEHVHATQALSFASNSGWANAAAPTATPSTVMSYFRGAPVTLTLNNPGSSSPITGDIWRMGNLVTVSLSTFSVNLTGAATSVSTLGMPAWAAGTAPWDQWCTHLTSIDNGAVESAMTRVFVSGGQVFMTFHKRLNTNWSSGGNVYVGTPTAVVGQRFTVYYTVDG